MAATELFWIFIFRPVASPNFFMICSTKSTSSLCGFKKRAASLAYNERRIFACRPLSSERSPPVLQAQIDGVGCQSPGWKDKVTKGLLGEVPAHGERKDLAHHLVWPRKRMRIGSVQSSSSNVLGSPFFQAVPGGIPRRRNRKLFLYRAWKEEKGVLFDDKLEQDFEHREIVLDTTFFDKGTLGYRDQIIHFTG